MDSQFPDADLPFDLEQIDADLHVHVAADDWTVGDSMLHPRSKPYRFRMWLVHKLLPPDTIVMSKSWPGSWTLTLSRDADDDESTGTAKLYNTPEDGYFLVPDAPDV